MAQGQMQRPQAENSLSAVDLRMVVGNHGGFVQGEPSITVRVIRQTRRAADGDAAFPYALPDEEIESRIARDFGCMPPSDARTGGLASAGCELITFESIATFHCQRTPSSSDGDKTGR
jgi:hypothetical protein